MTFLSPILDSVASAGSAAGAARERPDDGACQRFLLAYHYMADGYPENAARQLQEVVKLVPNDRVAADLLRMLECSRRPQLNAQQNAGGFRSRPRDRKCILIPNEGGVAQIFCLRRFPRQRNPLILMLRSLEPGVPSRDDGIKIPGESQEVFDVYMDVYAESASRSTPFDGT